MDKNESLNHVLNNLREKKIVNIVSQRGGGKTTFIVKIAKSLSHTANNYKMLIIVYDLNAKMELKNIIGDSDNVTILCKNEINYDNYRKYNIIVNENIDSFIDITNDKNIIDIVDLFYHEKNMLYNEGDMSVIINTLKMPNISSKSFYIYKTLNELSDESIYFFFNSNGILMGECKNSFFKVY